MPLVPAGRIDLFVKLAVQKHHGCVWPPRTSQEYFADIILRCNPAVIKNIAACLLRIMLALRRNHAFFVRDNMNQAVVEDRQGIAKDEIDISFNVTIAEILARRDTWAGVRFTRPGCGKQSVLCAQEANVAENGAVATN